MTDNNDAQRPSQAGKDNEGALDDLFVNEILTAVESGNLPEFYANSFAVNIGTGDVTLVMKRNNKQIGIIQMSYTVAKSLIVAINELLERMERATGHEIMTSKYIAERMLEDITSDDATNA